jgi:hypothetical protein
MLSSDLVAKGQDGARLPAAVHDLAMRLGANPQGQSQRVTLEQVGRMKLSLDAKRWTPFTARQDIWSETCAFDWRARMAPFGAISVQDALLDGEGRLSVKALGFVPIARAEHSAALTRSELMRYLAELAWAPDAIFRNTALRWRELGADMLAVSAGIGEGAAEVVMNLDSDGRIASGLAPDRPRSLTAPLLPTRWPWRFWDYRQCAGRWIPFAGEVGWEIDGKEIVYWQGQLKSWSLETAPR